MSHKTKESYSKGKNKIDWCAKCNGENCDICKNYSEYELREKDAN